MLPIFGIKYFFKELRKNNINKKMILFFLIMSFTFELFISAVFMIDISREDQIYYIRYCEFAILLFAGIGFNELIEQSKNQRNRKNTDCMCKTDKKI